MTNECQSCGEVNGVRPGRKYCSRGCYYKSKKRQVERICLVCGGIFMTTPNKNKKYCSKECAGTQFGQVKCLCEFCGETFFRKLSVVQRGRVQFCSKKCHGLARRGEKSPNWKGATWRRVIRDSSEYKEWRNMVYARDNWTCQDCGIRGGDLHAHHVFTFKEFPEHRFNVWNGITLCLGCHGKIHPNLKVQQENNMEASHDS